MKKVVKIAGIIALVIVLVLAGLAAYVYIGMSGIPESHVEGNVPTEDNFDEYLSRDLNSYFDGKFEETVSVTYELLRKQPTQSGISSPKFYLWVNISNADTNELIDEGAVRVGANAKESFTVTDYVPVSEIRDGSVNLEEVFPQDVVNSILSRTS